MHLDDKTQINRLLIYFFYDDDGIVDRYVPYILNDLKKNVSEICVVVNSKLTPEGRAIFTELAGNNLIVRENVGFDIWAYKTALECYGREKLSQYDEIILMNHTIMGPIYPFSEVFESMNERDVDFWGLTAFHEVSYDPNGTISLGYIPKYLQSHFIAVRSSMFNSYDFHFYWETLPDISSYGEALGKHEANFTKTFSDKGFKYDCYVDTSDLERYTECPILKAPLELLRDKRCPIFKRRSFFHDYQDYLNSSYGSQGRGLLEFLENETNYDTDMIWENIIRTCNLADIKNCLSLNYFLPENYSISFPGESIKIALILHIYYEDLIDYCFQYALSMPKNADIIITTDTDEKIESAKRVFGNSVFSNVKYVLIENRGRDVSALLLGAKPYVNNYDLVCFMHDKKVPYLLGITGHHFSERCFKNCLGSADYVNNIIHTMISNKHLGILCPPPPNFGHYYPTIGHEWAINYKNTIEWANTIGIKAQFNPNKEPISPLGTMFWFKPAALKPMFDYNWIIEDFPKEPNKSDGSTLHALERLYSFCAQSQGFYSAWCMTVSQAQLELTNVLYELRGLNTILFTNYGLQPYHILQRIMVSNKESKRVQKRILIKNRIKTLCPPVICNIFKRIYHRLGGKKWIG